jgi:hypothetical protein
MGMDVVAQIRRTTRKQFTAEEKIRIILHSPWAGVPCKFPQHASPRQARQAWCATLSQRAA